MTGEYLLSPLAQSDLEDILNHTQSRWGSEQAEICIRQLWRDIEAIAVQPTRGRPCPEVRAGYRKYRSGSHVLFYRMTANDVDVVRILHQRMDFNQHLPEP